jgi:hypothetical protein
MILGKNTCSLLEEVARDVGFLANSLLIRYDNGSLSYCIFNLF